MKSMTGYGAALGKVGHGRLYIEIKTVNHRYCEIFFKLPPRMGVLESHLREVLQNQLERGRVECFIKEVEPIFGVQELVLDVGLAKKYQKALKELQKNLKLRSELNPLAIVGVDHFIQSKEKEGNYRYYWKSIERLLKMTLSHVASMRCKEGNHILKDQKLRLKSLNQLLKKVGAQTEHNAKRRRTNAVQNGNGETLLAADRMDTTEELIRLKSHVHQYMALLGQHGAVGRKIDFLIQEMHREINTVGSKASDAKISQYIVECKSLLENLREQIQNVI